MRQIPKKSNGGSKTAFRLDGSTERSDISRLGIILSVGFGVAGGYGSLSRDRFIPELASGKTLEQLQAFCHGHLNGSPVPGADPIRDGPVLLSMFQAAEMKGLVVLKFQKAGRFLPEKGSEFKS